MSGVVERAQQAQLVERAKKVAAVVISFLNSPRALLVPADFRVALGDFASIIVELARRSHSKFDMSPYDFQELVREVESLRAFRAHLIKRGVAADPEVSDG
jgi:hypothetical protein